MEAESKPTDEEVQRLQAEKQALLIAKKNALLKRVKSLSTTQYLVSAAREGAMASLLAAPALLVGFTLQGMIVARFPLLMRGRAGVEPEPAPQTFGGLFTAGLRHAGDRSLRTMVWMTATTAACAAAYEVLHIGPRFIPWDPIEERALPRQRAEVRQDILSQYGVGFTGGAALCALIMPPQRSWRRVALPLFAGVVAMRLPQVLAELTTVGRLLWGWR